MIDKEKIREELKTTLLERTGCGIQHDGWTCGTCSNGVIEGDEWGAVLWIRGDYSIQQLNDWKDEDDKATYTEEYCLSKAVQLLDRLRQG